VEIQEQVIAWLAQQEVDTYLVGGCVRDRLLSRHSYDLDVATPGDGLALARRLANHFRGDYYPLDVERATGRAILHPEGEHRLVVDIARFRGSDLGADLADRDLTINALAASTRTPDKLLDYHGGLADLEARQIRAVSDGSIRNDPVRALRAIRLSAQLSFVLTRETEALIRRDGRALAQVAGERIRDELARLLLLPTAANYLGRLDDLDLLTPILPELEPLRGLPQPAPHCLDALRHSLATVDALEQLLEEGTIMRSGSAQRPEERGLRIHEFPSFPEAGPLSPFRERVQAHVERVMSDDRPRLVTLKLAALLHNTGKPAAQAVSEEGRLSFIGHDKIGARITGEALTRLRLSSAEVRVGETIVRQHMRALLLAHEQSVTARAVYRLFRDTGDAGVDVLLHALADHRATYGADQADGQWLRLVSLTTRMMADYWERHHERVTPSPVIDGSDLLHGFGLQPGPQIGELLEMVREAQVSGEVHTREEALALVRGFLAMGNGRRVE
jgi:tRNA nucleotidyltransferase/poly(A) polymerase